MNINHGSDTNANDIRIKELKKALAETKSSFSDMMTANLENGLACTSLYEAYGCSECPLRTKMTGKKGEDENLPDCLQSRIGRQLDMVSGASLSMIEQLENELKRMESLVPAAQNPPLVNEYESASKEEEEEEEEGYGTDCPWPDEPPVSDEEDENEEGIEDDPELGECEKPAVMEKEGKEVVTCRNEVETKESGSE